MEATMDSPMRARVTIIVAALLVLISLFADQMGLGRSPGFGWKQIFGVVVGAAGRGLSVVASGSSGEGLSIVTAWPTRYS